MQIHLTFDYELFFGSNSGTIKNCILNPTNQLLEIARTHNVVYTFYIDAGYVYQLKKHSHIQQCANDYLLISNQLKQLQAEGHEIGLHVHPHWEDSYFQSGKWIINTMRYKLASFTEQEVIDIVSNYHMAITEITKKTCKSYRAGGWCVQPFDSIAKALQDNSIFVDSSVYYNGKHLSPAHSYDFSEALDKDEWRFNSNPCIQDNKGAFTEIPTTPDVIPPLFYWRLYTKMKLNSAIYKPVGDGNWLVDKKRLYKHFYSSTNHFACADGFFASRLITNLKKREAKNYKRFTVLSHPKSMAQYSFTALEKFITYAKRRNHCFTTIAS